MAHDLKSMQIDDEAASKYFINYIRDEVDDLRNNQMNTAEIDSHKNINDLDLSRLPNSLIITCVPHELFTNQQLKVREYIFFSHFISYVPLSILFKDEFEQLFRRHDSDIVVLYLKFFQRVRITFSSSCTALQARLHLHEYVFYNHTLKTYFASVSEHVTIDTCQSIH
jgi:hypothetical protein